MVVKQQHWKETNRFCSGFNVVLSAVYVPLKCTFLYFSVCTSEPNIHEDS